MRFHKAVIGNSSQYATTQPEEKHLLSLHFIYALCLVKPSKLCNKAWFNVDKNKMFKCHYTGIISAARLFTLGQTLPPNILYPNGSNKSKSFSMIENNRLKKDKIILKLEQC